MVEPGAGPSVEALFATPLIVEQSKNAESLNLELAPVILERRKSHAGVTISNIDGWQSSTDMVKWGGEAARALVGHILALADRYTRDIREEGTRRFEWYTEMWANISPPGASNSFHMHPGAYWSAVYYVDDGYGGRDPRGQGGTLRLVDPRMPTVRMSDPDLRFLWSETRPDDHNHHIVAKSGMLVMFPAWLGHEVTPYRGDGTRISVAINLTTLPAR